MYDTNALERLLEIRLYRSIGLTINEIRTILERDDLKRQRLLKRYSTKVEKESGSSFLSDILLKNRGYLFINVQFTGRRESS